jgi:hypothetical protein
MLVKSLNSRSEDGWLDKLKRERDVFQSITDETCLRLSYQGFINPQNLQKFSSG